MLRGAGAGVAHAALARQSSEEGGQVGERSFLRHRPQVAGSTEESGCQLAVKCLSFHVRGREALGCRRGKGHWRQPSGASRVPKHRTRRHKGDAEVAVPGEPMDQAEEIKNDFSANASDRRIHE